MARLTVLFWSSDTLCVCDCNHVLWVMVVTLIGRLSFPDSSCLHASADCRSKGNPMLCEPHAGCLFHWKPANELFLFQMIFVCINKCIPLLCNFFCAESSARLAHNPFEISWHKVEVLHLEVGVNILQASQEVCSQGAAAAGLWETMFVCVVKCSFSWSSCAGPSSPSSFQQHTKNKPTQVCMCDVSSSF